MSVSPVVTPQRTQLQQRWPRTLNALERSYCQHAEWAVTQSRNQNDAGYMLWALKQFSVIVNNLLAHKAFSRAELDVAAAREVLYHWHRGTQFRRPAAALGRCICNLPTERPEKLDLARRWLAHRTPHQQARASAPTPIGQILAHHDVLT
jgi:hypothetical protein